MNIIEIIEQEMERNPDNWRDIAAQRIEASYRNNRAINVSEYSFTFVATIITTMTIIISTILIGVISLV